MLDHRLGLNRNRPAWKRAAWKRAGVAALVIASTCSCAHVGEGGEPLSMVERVVSDVCIPFVIDAIDDREVGRRLGGWWTRNPPDPLTPPQGPIFRRSGATVQVIDGRHARTTDGALTRLPMRSCVVFIGSVDEGALVAAVTKAASNRPDMRLLDAPVREGTRRMVACVPSGTDRIASINAFVHPGAQDGASVLQTPGRCPI